ncbi:homeobox-leucine zipper protein MERISTEM L1-like isoform X1 [Cynara cardunculus var. scolymus]|uniref:homeobox-leucine zipper protein MERISTEM L1-like isoform X1 n=1 Tax=Cynara cardunculus var. scolymus TaxID=59895 RepID=UPI000D625B52|nr:homeobox-leucine zipper protein MERISTEM L1-like isoform X1 [Cynara cardunculus var. scolymus]XP_024988633.1 homeobox-leucine zipper protein MERISTEM L1-like isoform X1 [Cynara cardunculus var. scolymus]XP_024988634.1 homeobox-leucine zipper protein MERISTEM L1-like isoform X1 [Cynara cardunculus var. scolymus]XP_024988635.1 homeobox-leucine zipper protein MERISTEM L1-like isoform X1 [Cynara cardunculus var. scolymus]XP_024988636.1 homeobox-leucine zipper protein MERISTEM L1-like isoform X1 
MFQPNMFESHHHILDMSHKTPEHELDMLRDEDYESKSGTDIMEAHSGDDQDPNQRPNKKKRYHRHTQHQIQEMESFFKECPHPDDKQRKELGRRLSLEPLQVKFWFQNKRTQMKAQHERHENTQLRNENEKLRSENIRYKEALANATCPNCGGPAAIGEMSFDEQHLRIENARLREEIDRISGIAAKYVGKPMLSYPNMSPHGPTRSLDLAVASFSPQQGMVGDMFGANDILRSVSGPTEADKPIIIELAVAAMEELIRMAQSGEPLWVPNSDNSSETLSDEEYLQTFPRGIGPKPLGLQSEASRESAVVIMNHITLVEILMDVNQWSNVFSGIVSRAMTLEVLSTGVAGNYNGALQVMTAEYQVPSPLVPTRENYFVRYCKQHSDGTWAVVDVSLDNLRPSSISRCRRRPSGCLIQELPNGYSKVTWVEHVEVDDRAVHNIYRLLVNSGLAFGAKRWVATLDRQCERLASAMANNIPAGDVGVITTPEGRKSMLKLAERMVLSFCSGVGASTAHTWTTLSGSGADDVRVMTRKSMNDPGRPPGIVLSAATSFWIPVQPKRVFDFLRDENSRSEWDILSNGGLVQEMAHIANGRDQGNCVSLLRVNSANSSQSNMLILQESSSDSTGSYVIYAPVDIVAMNVVLSGGDPDYVALLPSGFAILPDGPGQHQGGIAEVGTGGSLLTVAFQILVDSTPTAKLSLGSVATVNSLIKCTVERIKAAVGSP